MDSHAPDSEISYIVATRAALLHLEDKNTTKIIQTNSYVHLQCKVNDVGFEWNNLHLTLQLNYKQVMHVMGILLSLKILGFLDSKVCRRIGMSPSGSSLPRLSFNSLQTKDAVIFF